ATDGLLILITRALDKLQPGEILEILSDNPSVEHDLTAWTRLTANRWMGTVSSNGRRAYRIEKGSALRVLTDRELDWGQHADIKHGQFSTRDWLLGHVAEIRDRARPSDGFAPRGAVVENGSPAFPFDVLERNQAWSEGAAEFYEQATASQ